MTDRKRIVRAALIAALTAAAGISIAEAKSAVKPESARTALKPPVGASLRRAGGEIVARTGFRNAGREVLDIRLRGLGPLMSYGLFCDDPATADPTPQQFATFRAGPKGRHELRLDTARGDTLPFGASIDLLAAGSFQVRDAAGFLVLSGGMPDPRGVRLAEATECRFVEETAFEDNFDADTAATAPAGWDVSGNTVLADSAVFDGASGLSVAIADVDPLIEAPQMSHSFTAQDGFFAVEFALFSSGAAGRVVFQLGDDSSGTTVLATGLGDGLGLYENGSIGFGAADTIQAYTGNTKYQFRIDVDVAAKKFDVSIDGTKVVTGRDLGFTGTSLDRISFTTTATTTGTANVDTVKVIHETQDCPPVANAGPDQAIEVEAATTAVTLDGSASADPEGATLTYAWSGDFTELTATGVSPTVHWNGVGSHTVTLVVNDGFFDSAPDQVVIDLVDTTPPVLTVTGLPVSIWPPNHDMHTIHPTIVATDNSGEEPTVTLTITSNEPDNGIGDGNTSGDFAIRSPSDFDLRAERAGPGSGRIYHLVWTATDGSGNHTSFSADILIPHDQGHGQGNDTDAGQPGQLPAPGEAGVGVSTGEPDNGNGNGNGNGHGNGRGHGPKHKHKHT